MKPLPLWYSAALIVIGALLQLLASGAFGVIFIACGVLGLILKLRIRRLDRGR
jgi:hypothetical protein